MRNVYFLQSSDGPIKIGLTWNVNKRVDQIQISTPAELRILGVIPGEMALESEIHKKFEHLKIKGEWFKPGQDLLDFIANNVQDIPNLEKASDECSDLIAMADKLSETLPDEEELLTIEQASYLLGVSQQTLRNWEKQGKINPQRTATGGHRRYPKKEIIGLKKQQINSTELIFSNLKPGKFVELFQQMLSIFNPEENVHLTIQMDTVNEKVRFVLDSEDGLTTTCKSFKMED